MCSFKIFLAVIAMLLVAMPALAQEVGVITENSGNIFGLTEPKFKMLGLIIGMVALPTLLIKSREKEQQQPSLFSGFDRIAATTFMVVGTLMVLESLQDMPFEWWPALTVIRALVVANSGKKLSYVAAFLYICSMGAMFFFVEA